MDKDNYLKLPKISIVTPSYNQGKFIEKTILSVLNQNYTNLEYIIIDGGSTDESVEIIKKYEKKLHYWISEKDSGQSEALNKGFAKAGGEIFGYLNSDDIYLDNTLNFISDFFNNNKKVDIVYGNCLVIDERDKVLNLSVALPFKLEEHLNGVFSIPQPGSFWKAEVFKKAGEFNINNHTCMDGEFFAKAGLKDFKFKSINKNFASFRIHTSSKTGDYTSSLKEKYLEDQKDYIESLSKRKRTELQKKIHSFLYTLKYLPMKLKVRLLWFNSSR